MLCTPSCKDKLEVSSLQLLPSHSFSSRLSHPPSLLLGLCHPLSLSLPLTLSLTLITHLQVGSSLFFDLVDYDKLDPSRTFRVRKLTQFGDFKKQVMVCGGKAGAVVVVWSVLCDVGRADGSRQSAADV